MFNWFNRSSKSAAAAAGGALRIEPRSAAVMPPPGAASEESSSADAGVPARLTHTMQQMSPGAQRILLLLPSGVSLASSCAAYPQAVERLLSQWHKPAEFHRALDSMLVDRRGGRQGFPFDVLAEFSALGEYYDLHISPSKVHGWSSVDPR
jgi:hypothetical protein